MPTAMHSAICLIAFSLWCATGFMANQGSGFRITDTSAPDTLSVSFDPFRGTDGPFNIGRTYYGAMLYTTAVPPCGSVWHQATEVRSLA